jgi:hypothetical protein
MLTLFVLSILNVKMCPSGAALSVTSNKRPTVTIMEISEDPKVIRFKTENPSNEEIILISPTHPDFVIDHDTCSVEVSTRVAEWNAPYAFTPQIEKLGPGMNAVYEIAFTAATLRKDVCKRRTVKVSLSYMTAKAGAGLHLGSSQNSRRHVLRYQRIVSSRPVSF